MKFEYALAKKLTFSKNSESDQIFFFCLFSALGVMVSVASLILGFSIGSGFKEGVERKLTNVASHITLRNVKEDVVLYDEQMVKKLEFIKGVKYVLPVWDREVVLKKLDGGNNSDVGTGQLEPALLKAVNDEMPFVKNSLVEGGFSDNVNVFSLILGQNVAEKLSVSVGDDIMVVSLNQDKRDSFNFSVNDILDGVQIEYGTVSGIFKTGMLEGFDDRLVYTSLENVQREPGFLQDTGVYVTKYEIFLHDIKEISSVLADINQEVGYPYLSITVYEAYHSVFSWLKFQQNITPLLLMSMVIVAGFNMFSLLLISILTRRRFIGVLTSLGVSQSQLKRIFLGHAFLISGIGIIAGNLLSLLLIAVQKEFSLFTLDSHIYFLDTVPLEFYPMVFFKVSIGTLIACLFASFLPTNLIGKLSPIEVLRS